MNTPMAEAVQILAKLKGLGSTAQKIVQGCEIILSHQKRKHVQLVVQNLGCHYQMVYKWVRRWNKELPGILEKWQDKDFNREKAILNILQDAPRSGTPSTYTAEQITLIIALGCRGPEEFERPITHWTMPELADEVVKQGIVEKVSETSLRRFF